MNSPREVDLGYAFSPPGEHFTMGHSRLDVQLLPEPSLRHFDPEMLQAPLREFTSGGSLSVVNRKIHHPWHGPKQLRVTPGRICMRDRVGKVQEAFSFGGTMQVMTSPEKTICSLRSPAPIFELFDGNKLPDLFIQEVEILLAQLRARMTEDPAALTRRLATVEPAELYVSMLGEVKRRLEAFERCGLPDYQRLLRQVRCEVRAWRKMSKWPASEPTPQRLLLGGAGH